MPNSKQWSTLCALALACSAAHAQNCLQPTGTGTPDADFNATFTQPGPGWTGGDSTYSRRLPDGRTLYFFSDSYIASSVVPNGAGAEPGTRVRSNPIFQGHNSIVVLNTDGSVATLSGGDPTVSPTSLFSPANTNDLYWMGDSTVQPDGSGGNVLKLLLLEFNASTYAFVGTSVATLSLPSLAVQSITPLSLSPGVEWGSAVLQSGPYLYVYGIEDLPSGKYPHVARMAPGDLGNPDAWTFWDGTDWVRGAQNAARILTGTDSISNEFNVNHIHAAAGNAYVMTTMDTSVGFGAWKDVVMYFSCGPQGPWSPKQVVYTTPETGEKDQTGQGTLLTYNPHSHFESIANGSVLISYDLNDTNGNDLIFMDNYRPLFIRVPIAGLEDVPGGGGATPLP